MQDKPFISVIIPNYNYASYVADCIRSVLDQDYDQFELIVVDDGSRDDSWSVIETFGSRIRALRVDNGGPRKACLAATDLAKGEYIYILDSDDRLSRPDALTIIAEACASRPTKLQFPLTPVDARGNIIGDSFPDLPPHLTSQQLVEQVLANGFYMTPPTSGNVYRRDLWEVAREVDYEPWTDGIVYLLCPFRGDVITLPKSLAQYRVHGLNDSATRSMSERIVGEIDRFRRRIEHLRTLIQPDLAARLGPVERYFFVAERTIQESSLEGRHIGPTAFLRAYGSLFKEHQGLRRKMLMFSWLFGLSLAPKKMRRELVLFRDKPHNRSRLLKALKRFS